MPPAIIGAGIAAAGTIGGAAIASKGAKSAAKTTQQGTDAAIAAQERAYQQSAAALAPWQQGGLEANSLLRDALGFNAGQQSAQQLPAPQPNALAQFQGYNPDSTGGVFGAGNSVMGAPIGLVERPEPGFSNNGIPAPNAFWQNQMANPGQTPGFGAGVPQGQAQPQAAQPNARSAFDTFLDSINYKWQLEQGQDAINSGYAGRGVLQSGAAMKGITDYNQNMARGAFQDWYGGVENMANRGFGAASAQAGVSQNLGANTAQLQSANANALANLQIQKANSLGGALGGLGVIGANVLGGMGGYGTPPIAPSSGLGGAIINTSSARR